MKRAGMPLVVILAVFLAGCGINNALREKIVTTGIFNDKPDEIKKALSQLRPDMTKEEVRAAGFKFENKNVQCLQGSQAMQYVVGDVKNTVDLSTIEKLENYAKMVNSFEACIFPHQILKTEKARWFFSDDGGKTKGPELLFVLVFKDSKLLKTEISYEKNRDEVDREKSFGGNILENVLGAAVSAGRRFR